MTLTPKQTTRVRVQPRPSQGEQEKIGKIELLLYRQGPEDIAEAVGRPNIDIVDHYQMCD